MALNSVKILYKGGTAEIEVKKSRFIANLKPVESEEEAAAFIAEIKKKYWDARHNCQAFTIGMNHELTRCSDDGEPAQTAGRPMLDVLLGEDVHNACVVVTRYFGGTLLGTGGLVRAYSGAVKEGLAASEIVEKKRAFEMKIVTDYTGIGKIQYILGQENMTVLDSVYMSIPLTIPSLLAPRRTWTSISCRGVEAVMLSSRVKMIFDGFFVIHVTYAG